MRSSSFRWLLGACAAALVAVTLVPTAGAMPINGAIFWRDAAEVHGFLHVDPAGGTILSQSLRPAVAAPDYAWTMVADNVHLNVNARHETKKVAGFTVVSRAGPSWENTTSDFHNARVLVELTPTHDFGSSAILRKGEGALQARLAPVDGSAALVRSVDPQGELMSVPASSDRASMDRSFEYSAPAGHMLEVSGPAMTRLDGSLATAFFGWRITIASPDQASVVIQTGIEKDRDPTTGVQIGTVLRYATFTADGAAVTLPPFEGDAKLYTPVLRYDGKAEYPSGLYHGRNQGLAPQNQERMALDGAIVLTAFEDNPFEQNYVRAWGEADWVAAQAAPVHAAPIVASALPVLLAAGGLFVGGQLLPSLLRGVRMGGFLLYARLREQNVTANPTRERIYEAIKAEPGQNLSKMVETLDLGWGTAAYHVAVLKRQNRVKELRFLNRVCFFAGENHQESTKVATVLLRQSNYREVMTVLETSPGLSQREVAAQTGHARQYVSRMVAKMERAGLLRAEPSRSGRKYFPQGNRGTGAPDLPFIGSRPVGGPTTTRPTPTMPVINAATNPY